MENPVVSKHQVISHPFPSFHTYSRQPTSSSYDDVRKWKSFHRQMGREPPHALTWRSKYRVTLHYMSSHHPTHRKELKHFSFYSFWNKNMFIQSIMIPTYGCNNTTGRVLLYQVTNKLGSNNFFFFFNILKK